MLHDASIDSSMNEAFLQHQCIMTWGKCGGLGFTYYTTHVTPHYKTILFMERGHRIEPIHCLSFKPLLPCDLAHMHCDVRRALGHK